MGTGGLSEPSTGMTGSSVARPHLLLVGQDVAQCILFSDGEPLSGIEIPEGSDNVAVSTANGLTYL